MNKIVSNSYRRCAWGGCLLLSLLLSVSCEKQPEMEVADTGTMALNFSASVSPKSLPQQRSVVDGDKFPIRSESYPIGIWICKEESENPSSFAPSMRGYNNLLANLLVAAKDQTSLENIWTYTFDGRDHTILSVRRNKAVDIYAYHPWVEGADNLRAIPFVSGEDDWMWAEPCKLTAEQTNVTGDELVEVPLYFTHAMTCIQVKMICKYAGRIVLEKMTLTDSKGRLYAKGTMDALTGELALSEIDKGNSIVITPMVKLKNGEYQNFCIMMPAVENYADKEFTLSFVFDGIDGREDFPLPAVMNELDGNGQKTGNAVTVTAFETGKRYIYELTLNNEMRFAPVGVDEEWAETGGDDDKGGIDLEL